MVTPSNPWIPFRSATQVTILGAGTAKYVQRQICGVSSDRHDSRSIHWRELVWLSTVMIFLCTVNTGLRVGTCATLDCMYSTPGDE